MINFLFFFCCYMIFSSLCSHFMQLCNKVDQIIIIGLNMIWCVGWNDPLDWEWKAVVRNCLLLKRFANLINKLLKKSLPWSVSTPFGAPNMQINFFTNASTIVPAWWIRRDIARENFVKLSCLVRIYKFPDFVSGSRPAISINIFSKAVVGVLVITEGFLVLTRTNFFIWHCKQPWIYF